MILIYLTQVFLNAKSITEPKINPPANLTILYSDSTVTIDWDSVPNTSKYYIYNQSDPYSIFVLVDSTISTTWNGNFTENKEFFKVSAKETPSPDGMVFVQGGTFQMGDHFNEGDSDELPVHSVTVSDFYIGKYEVTQKEWEIYMPTDTYDSGVGNDYPVYYVSWYEIIKTT